MKKKYNLEEFLDSTEEKYQRWFDKVEERSLRWMAKNDLPALLETILSKCEQFRAENDEMREKLTDLSNKMTNAHELYKQGRLSAVPKALGWTEGKRTKQVDPNGHVLYRYLEILSKAHKGTDDFTNEEKDAAILQLMKEYSVQSREAMIKHLERSNPGENPEIKHLIPHTYKDETKS